MVTPRLLILLYPTHYSHRQPAIDYLSMRLMRRFNASTNGSGSASTTNESKTKATKKEHTEEEKKKNTVLLYNTYQLYLDDGRGRLEAHLQVAKEEGFALGVKAVRQRICRNDTGMIIQYDVPQYVVVLLVATPDPCTACEYKKYFYCHVHIINEVM